MSDMSGEVIPQAPMSQADVFHRLIRNTGPISLAQFMGESNARYYAAKDPLGSEGDFITAPEISQMFGELIGLWPTCGSARGARHRSTTSSSARDAERWRKTRCAP